MLYCRSRMKNQLLSKHHAFDYSSFGIIGRSFLWKRSWRSGPNYKLLTLNEWSSNYTKYKEQLDAENRTSVLTIRSFSESEVDIIYQCSYGFSSYDAVLQLTKHRYEYHPAKLVPVTLIVNRTHIYAIVTLEKVFPKPQCYAHAGEKDITQESLKVKSNHNGIFYKSIVDFKYMVDSQHHCVGLVAITCTIGTANTTLAKNMFSCHHNGKSL
ncbi:unnamed protein product [Mytilus coruscus]|uniref:Uncharacterized protein n=1 Tax=Mytilus coruscus TaxID=42192 RepID=A0A6J8DLD0_MYTCO|nr:unnamed protein product [Mytilus coruscus]